MWSTLLGLACPIAPTSDLRSLHAPASCFQRAEVLQSSSRLDVAAKRRGRPVSIETAGGQSVVLTRIVTYRLLQFGWESGNLVVLFHIYLLQNRLRHLILCDCL